MNSLQTVKLLRFSYYFHDSEAVWVVHCWGLYKLIENCVFFCFFYSISHFVHESTCQFPSCEQIYMCSRQKVFPVGVSIVLAPFGFR